MLWTVALLYCSAFLCGVTAQGIKNDTGTNTHKTIFKGPQRSVAERTLREQILLKYDKSVMPNSNNTRLLMVKLGMVLIGIQKIDVWKQTVAISAWMKVEWNDERLIWNATEHSNLFSLPFSDADIYVPEILLYNRYRARDTHLFGQTMAIAYHHSEVIWLPPSSLEVPCAMDMSSWPFDTHECQFVFGHASRDNTTFELYPESLTVDSSMVTVQPTEWNFINSSSFRVQNYFAIGDNYDTVRFNLTFQRIPQPFLRSVYFPPLIIFILSGLLFWIRDQNFRVLFGTMELTGSLALTINFWMIMPPSIKLPRIAYLMAACPILVTTVIVLTLLLDLLPNFNFSVPWWIRNSRKKLKNIQMFNFSNGNTNDHTLLESDISSVILTDGPYNPQILDEDYDDWVHLVTILKMALFLVYIFVCFMLFTLCYFL